MISSLSNIVDNLDEGTYKIKCKYGHDNEKCITCRIKYKYCDCFLEYTNVKDDLREYIHFCCNKNYQKKFDGNLKKRFVNTYKLSNHDINKFFLCCSEKVFTHMNICMIGKSSMKHHYMRKKIFTATEK